MDAICGLLLMESMVADSPRGRTPILARNSNYLFLLARSHRCILLLDMSSAMKRPVGVTILALIYLWIGCFGTVFFSFIAGFGAFSTPWDHFAGNVIHSELWLRITLFALLSAWYLFYIAYAVIGFGLWKLKNWARKFAVGINLFFAIAAAVALPIFARPALIAIPLFIGTIPPFIWIVWYLRRPRVSYAFGALVAPAGDSSNATPSGLSKVGIAWVVIGVIATLSLFFVSVFVLVESMFHASSVYSMALAKAQESPCVVQKLGTPMKPDWMTSGQINETNDEGNAELSIPISGPKGSGSLELKAKRENRVWEIQSLILEHDVDRIQIVPLSSDCP
jgi:Cytochrome oxidase complex assembly protein 1